MITVRLKRFRGPACDIVHCPYCGSYNVTYLERARRFKCHGPHPKAQFSLKVGTVFEDSAVGWGQWLPALWMLVNSKVRMSSHRLADALGVTQKTAWFMLAPTPHGVR